MNRDKRRPLSGGRLGRIYELVSEAPAGRLVDLGSDHATVPIEILKKKILPQVLVTDIREGPLSAARKRAARENISEGFQAVRADGLTGISLLREDILLISGMGGETLAGILERGRAELVHPSRIILSPQTREEVLRTAMQALELPISDEILLLDRDEVYLILVSDKGGPLLQMSPFDLYFGPRILEKIKGDRGLDRPGEREALDRYLAKRIRRLLKQSAHDPDSNDLLLQWKRFEKRFPLPYNKEDQG